ncbi:MAG TPA: hypothetical protein EYP17_07000 [Candidatus Latescibacteria bacterium]|nr:hypothetical protein [Candidatus Latescibacterota bacterium]
MRCLGALGLVLALWTGVPAGVFDTPQTVPRGAYAVGIEHQVWVEPFSLGLFEHLGYGIGGRTDLGIHLGVEAEKPAYIGMDLERRVFGGGRGPMLSISAGAHYQDSLWVDLRASFGFGFPQLVAYFGVDVDVPVQEASEAPAVLFVGVGFLANPSLEYRFEALFGLGEEERQGVNIGAVWRF